MTKAELINRMNIIIEKSSTNNGYIYHTKIREWQNYGKDRTYFSITAARTSDGRTMKEKSYGYIDNETGEYHPERLGDLRENYTFGGMSFSEATEQETPDTTPTENIVAAPAEETMNKADELIKKYRISLAGDDRIRISNTAQVDKDNALDEIKALKPAIITRLEEIKAEKDRAAAERAAKIAAIEGLAEIKKAQDEIEEWNYRFNKSFEGEYAVGGMGVGKKPDYDLDAMYKKYPTARAYLRAEAESRKSNYEYAAIGRRALEAIINNPEDYENIMATMDAEISASVDRHLMTD